MAYETIVAFGRPLTTDEQTTMFNYIKNQMASGNTSGLVRGTGKIGLEAAQFSDLKLYSWQTQDQANAFVTFANTFSPAPTWTEVIVPGQPFVIETPPA